MGQRYGLCPQEWRGTEYIHKWGGKTANWKETMERVGWEVVLLLTGGGHEGGGSHRRLNVHKQKAEHGCAVYCYATASGPLQGGDAERGSAGNTEVVGSDGHRLVEGKGEGSGNGIGVRIGDRLGGGGVLRHRNKDKQIKWGGMERSECGQMGSS